MSSNNVITGYQFWTSQSMAGNLTSAALNINHMDNVGLQLNISAGATATGLFSVQVSADHVQDAGGNVLVAGNWVTILPSPSPAVTSGSPSNLYIDLNQLSSPWLRVIYTATSGTGLVDGFFVAKGY